MDILTSISLKNIVSRNAIYVCFHTSILLCHFNSWWPIFVMSYILLNILYFCGVVGLLYMENHTCSTVRKMQEVFKYFKFEVTFTFQTVYLETNPHVHQYPCVVDCFSQQAYKEFELLEGSSLWR